MNKTQLIILCLIIALAFYYLKEENKPKNNHPDEPWLIVKKSTKPRATKPKLTFGPPNNPGVELPSGENEPINQPANFGLNPPHSQLNEPEKTEPPEPATEILQFFTNNEENKSTLHETYRQKFLMLLAHLPFSLLTQQAAEVLQVKDQPLSEYFQAIWKLKGLTNYQEQIVQPLREWINLTTAFKPHETSTDYGWLTDDNLEFILNNYQPLQSARAKTKNFHLRTDIANIYNSFSKAKTNQEWDLLEFLQELELTKCQYTIFPLRVNGNHWGLFVLHDLTWQDLTPTYQVYYTSSGGMSLESEKQQLQPFIDQICGANTPIQIIQPQDRQSKGYECGVYLVFYLQEIFETKQLKLQRTHSSEACQQFRWEWKARIGEQKWCSLT